MEDPQPSSVALLPILIPRASCPGPKRLVLHRKTRNPNLRLFVFFNALTLAPADARRGGGLFAPARQAQLAKSFAAAKIDVIGMHECRLPLAQSSTIGSFTCVFQQCQEGTMDAAFG